MLSNDELERVARNIARCEKVIKQNKSSKAVKAARLYIDKTTQSLALEDLFRLDEKISKLLD